MDLSEREDQPSSDVEEDLECKKVSKRIAGVTLESDSLPESPASVAEERMVRRKKRMKRYGKTLQMDIDPSPKSNQRTEKYMDCDGAESHISSSDESLSEDNKDGEADDEQSDWVGDTTPTGNSSCEVLPFDRRLFLRKSQSSHHVSSLQKKIERFAQDGNRGELVLEMRVRDRGSSNLLQRYLFKYQLEVIRRHRGTIILRKKHDTPSTSARC